MTTQRDIFLLELLAHARVDKSIILLSVDMGSPALDRWRAELPEQFCTVGISEQFAINLAAGMAAAGRKVYVYFMASFVARCFEQVRYSCAMPNIPITILGNGVGEGYYFAGPAHNPTEDIAYMRSLVNVEIVSPANVNMIPALVELTVNEPKLRYVRLERSCALEVGDYYVDAGVPFVQRGFDLLCRVGRGSSSVAIISSGYMRGRAVNVAKALSSFHNVAVFDLWRIKPFPLDLVSFLDGFDYVVTLEEQSLSGGFGSAVLEAVSDHGLKPVRFLRCGLPERFIFENGVRDHLLDTNGLSVDQIADQIRSL